MKDALSYALKILQMKDYLSFEIYDKVSKKFSETDAKAVIDKLNSYGYLNDERVINNYIRSRLRGGYGEYYIVGKLYDKGVAVDNAKVQEIAEKEEIDIDETINTLKKRFIIKDDEDRFKLYNKCLNFLKSRGFSVSSIIKNVKYEEFKR